MCEQLTKANCAQPMDYFQSMLLMLLAFKAVLAMVLLLAWAVPWARKRWWSHQRWRAVPQHLRKSSTVRRRNKLGAPTKRVKATDWVKVRELLCLLSVLISLNDIPEAAGHVCCTEPT